MRFLLHELLRGEKYKGPICKDRSNDCSTHPVYNIQFLTQSFLTRIKNRASFVYITITSMYFASFERCNVIPMLNKVQRFFCLLITGVIKSRPPASLEIIYDIPPLIFSLRISILSPSYIWKSLESWGINTLDKVLSSEQWSIRICLKRLMAYHQS